MADIVKAQNDGVPTTMQSRYRDMGDGTHALITASVLSPGSSLQWTYVDGELITPGGAAAAATVPTTATIVEIRPEGGACYFQINAGAPASADSPGYVAEDGGEIVGPLSNLNSLQFFAAVGTDIHVMYFREAG